MVQGIVRGLAEYAKIVEEIHFTHIRKRVKGKNQTLKRYGSGGIHDLRVAHRISSRVVKGKGHQLSA